MWINFLRRFSGVNFAAVITALGILAGCSGQSTPSDALEAASDGPGAVGDVAVIEIIATGEGALEQARQRMPTAVLRQVDFGPEPGMLTFRFIDAAATRMLSVTFTAFRSDSGQWQAIYEGLTPYTGYPHPGMELGALRASPAAWVKQPSTTGRIVAPQGSRWVGPEATSHGAYPAIWMPAQYPAF